MEHETRRVCTFFRKEHPGTTLPERDAPQVNVSRLSTAKHREERTWDPITTAVVAALPALASDVVKSAVKDAYDALRAVIRRRWGEASPVARAVEALESDPSSREHASALQEKIADIKATEDPDVMKALAKLVVSLKKADTGGSATTQINLSVQGGNNQEVIGAQHVSIARLSFDARLNDIECRLRG